MGTQPINSVTFWKLWQSIQAYIVFPAAGSLTFHFKHIKMMFSTEEYCFVKNVSNQYGDTWTNQPFGTLPNHT